MKELFNMSLSKTLFVVALVTLNVLLVPTLSAPVDYPELDGSEEPEYIASPVINNIVYTETLYVGPINPPRKNKDPIPTPHIERRENDGPFDRTGAGDHIYDPFRPPRKHKGPIHTPDIIQRRKVEEPIYSILPIIDPIGPFKPHRKPKGPTPTRIITPHVNERREVEEPVYSLLPIIDHLEAREPIYDPFKPPFRYPIKPPHKHKGPTFPIITPVKRREFDEPRYTAGPVRPGPPRKHKGSRITVGPVTT